MNDSNVWYGRVYCVDLANNKTIKNAVYEFIKIVNMITGRKVICTNFGAFSFGAILYYNLTFHDLKREDVLKALTNFMDNEYYKNFETIIIFYNSEMEVYYEMRKLIDILAHYYDLRQFSYTAGITDVEYLIRKSKDFAEFKKYLDNYKENIQIVLNSKEEVDYFGNIFIMKKIFLNGIEYDFEKYYVEFRSDDDAPNFNVWLNKRTLQGDDKKDESKSEKEEREDQHYSSYDNYIPESKKEQIRLWKRRQEKEIESKDNLDILPERKTRSERHRYSRDFYRKDRFYEREDNY